MPQHDTLIRCPEFSLERKWEITVQTPEATLDELVSAIQEKIELVQGAYSHCMYIRRSGTTRFRNEVGAYGGVEEAVREVPSAEIILVIPHDGELLEQAIRCIAWHHVHEEPTLFVAETRGYLSVLNKNPDSPYRYWNRKDGDEIHGSVAVLIQRNSVMKDDKALKQVAGNVDNPNLEFSDMHIHLQPTKSGREE